VTCSEKAHFELNYLEKEKMEEYMKIARNWFFIAATALLMTLQPFSGNANEGDSLWPVPDYTGDFKSRPALTGDWGGMRTDWANKGVTLSVDNITTFQSVFDGGRNDNDETGGSLDYEIHLDFEKMGLWPGAFVRIFAETQYGNFVNSDTGAALPANADGIFPLPDEDETTLTSVIFYQFLSESFGIYLGKLDTIDGDANAFAGARGKDQFLNMNFVINPVTFRTTPYTALGGGFLYLLPEEKGVFTFAVLDANGQPDEAGFDDAFDDGTILAGELQLVIKPFGLQGHQLFGATWSSKDFTLLDQDPRILILKLLRPDLVTLDKADDSWSFYYNFDQYIYTEKDDPEQGVGLFGRFGIADEETSPIDSFYSIGIGGKGIIPGRDNDTFGIGYFYVGLSDDLPNPFDIPDDSQGAEFFYNFEVTPWLHITPDFQIIDPSLKRLDTAYIAGIRVKIDL
jgi:porin